LIHSRQEDELQSGFYRQRFTNRGSKKRNNYMLMISKKQMDALRLAMRAEFIRRTLAVLHDAVPDFLAGLDDAAALRRLEASVTKAESYGLSTERQIRDFIAVQTVAGEDFDSNSHFAAAREALTDFNQSPSDRLALARQRIAYVLARKDKG
jgi:hypothetical protein